MPDKVMCGNCDHMDIKGCMLNYSEMSDQEVANVRFDGDVEKLYTFAYRGLDYHYSGEPSQEETLNKNGDCGHFKNRRRYKITKSPEPKKPKKSFWDWVNSFNA